MPSKLASPTVQVSLSPLTQSSFSPFGNVISNPSKHPGKTALYTSTSANQGSAIKYSDVSDLTNFYTLAPSRRPAKPSVNLFSCSPRKLRVTGGQYTQPSAYPKAEQQTFFDVQVLERHPFTSQTFVPLGQEAGDPSTRYLVIVAPTLPLPKDRSDAERQPPYPQADRKPQRNNLLSLFSRSRPSPYSNEVVPPLSRAERFNGGGGANFPRGAGAPDLKNVRAFIATGDQAITYGPGTWHAPMVVLGKQPIDFVVVQYTNGVGSEDVQEVYLQGDGPNGEGVSVAISGVGDEVLMSGNMTVKANL